LLRPLEDREAIQTSRLEGTYATPRELLLLELYPQDFTTTNEKQNDIREVVVNHRLALTPANESRLPVCLRLIKETHAILMSGTAGRDKAPGEIRKIPVAIGHGGRFTPPPPQEVERCLVALEKYCHLPEPTYNPLVDCFIVHYQFETIHPFLDGNGRVGRLLLAIMLQQKNGLSKPCST
jgi:Fic family protein